MYHVDVRREFWGLLVDGRCYLGEALGSVEVPKDVYELGEIFLVECVGGLGDLYADLDE